MEMERGSAWANTNNDLLNAALDGACCHCSVGCIPKKLMHQAANIGEDMSEAHRFGWGVEPTSNNPSESSDPATTPASPSQSSKPPQPIQPSHHWPTLVEAVQQYIRSLNFGYRSRVTKDSNITYLNARGSLTGTRTVDATDAKGNVRKLTARKHIVIAVGGKPRYPSIPGAEFGITSDDIFSLRRSPGKTLVVGAGYIALESAGFLHGLGFDTTVMARSRYLRGFDEDISNMIVGHMKRHGVKFAEKQIPTKIEKLEDGKLRVWSKSTDSKEIDTESDEVYDTVLFAIGRDPRTQGLGLDKAGVPVETSGGGQHGKIILRDSGKDGIIPVADGDSDESQVPGIFALGDVAKFRPELTPVAISSAKLLARRLYGAKQAHPRLLDYTATPTTVFTPLEYGCVGWSEEEALRRFGGRKEKVEVFHSHFKPLSWALTDRETNACYVKIVVEQPENVSQYDPLHLSAHQKVVGLHFLGPNAGEVMQGFGVAFGKGLTREDLELAIGIHPTAAEEMLTADITKVRTKQKSA